METIDNNLEFSNSTGYNVKNKASHNHCDQHNYESSHCPSENKSTVEGHCGKINSNKFFSRKIWYDNQESECIENRGKTCSYDNNGFKVIKNSK